MWFVLCLVVLFSIQTLTLGKISINNVITTQLTLSDNTVDVATTEHRRNLPNSNFINRITKINGGNSPSSVIEITSINELEKLLKEKGKNKLVVLDFTASWCGPCKMIAPIYQDLAKQYKKAVFVKVTIDFIFLLILLFIVNCSLILFCKCITTTG